MISFLTLLLIAACVAAAVFYFQKQKLENEIDDERTKAKAAVTNAQKIIEQQKAQFSAEEERVRTHYEEESRKLIETMHAELGKTRAELEPLRALAALQQSEEEVKATLSAALAEATGLRADA